MEFKIVVSDPETGKSYQIEVKDEKARKLSNLRIGDELDGSTVGLTGYKLAITGGSDKDGFPMRKGIQSTSRPMVLTAGGVGYNPKREVRVRKRVRGERIGEDIVQVNTKVVSAGKKKIEELLGVSTTSEA